ncbi:MAG: FAD-dependent monooxygenase, partial [Pirellulaceae bacterium]|nr:FAD-dependent monooxygenase [Pirellulaceae bacterium]
MTNETEVLIAGAGPVGLALAAQLNGMGIEVAIMEQRETPSQLSKAGVVWGRSLELLDLCMNADDFLRAGRPLRKALIFSEGQEIAAIDFAKSDNPFGTGVMIPQNETERVITEHLESQGVSIRRGMELEGFEQHPQGVRCEVRSSDGQPEQWQADYLVGCDGAHSTVRHTLGLDFPGQQESHRWWLADVSAKGNMPDSEMVVCWSRSGILVLFRFTESKWRLIAEKPRTDPDTLHRDPTLADMQTLMKERGIGNIELYDPLWLSEFRINERKVDQYQVDRVFLAGDAAHIHSPVGGQGMNTGIQDACNLAWKIAWSQKL